MPMPSNVAGGELVFAAWGNSVVESLPPVGFLGMWPGPTPPPNWRIADGTAISRAAFPALWALFQASGAHTRYGLGDGTSTFNLPNYRGRYPIGVNSAGDYFSIGVGEVYGNKDGIVPSHQHSLEQHTHDLSNHQHYNSFTIADHVHGSGTDQGFMAKQSPGVPVIGFPVGGFETVVYPPTTAGGGGFTANFWSGVPNINATGGATGHNTNWAGSDVTNANLPPSLSVHFIIRVS